MDVLVSGSRIAIRASMGRGDDMLPQDQFNRRFDDLVASLSAWSDALRDTAELMTEVTQTYWRLRLDPQAAGACPVEIILHRNQTYDMMIGQESYEGLPLDAIETVQQVVAAIARGEVMTRITRSAATDQPIGVSTVVGHEESPLFERTRSVTHPLSPAAPRNVAVSDAVTHRRHYTPYRR